MNADRSGPILTALESRCVLTSYRLRASRSEQQDKDGILLWVKY